MALSGTPLAGKIAVVTGGSRGIGKAITRRLATWGCEVCIGYVERETQARALQEELLAGGTTAHLLKGDIAEPDQIEEMFIRLEELYSGIDILVLNAAATMFRTWSDLTAEHWDFIMGTDATSVWLMATRARRLMAGRKATIVTVSNGASTYYVDRLGPIGVSKAALESMTRSLGVELAADGIAVNCVNPPGVVATDVFGPRPDFRQMLANEAAHSPWGRSTTVDDCADAIAFLCLEEARWITGQTIILDGGMTVWR